MASIIDGDLHIRGGLSCEDFAPPANSIDNAAIETAAGILATKLQHQYKPTFSQNGTAGSVGAQVIHIVRGATGTLVRFRAGSIVANVGAATVTVDLKKNGTTMLSAVITLDSANTAYVPEDATLAASALVADDVLSVTIVATAGGGTLATGLFVEAEIREDAD